jgi:hypothetical protein
MTVYKAYVGIMLCSSSTTLGFDEFCLHRFACVQVTTFKSCTKANLAGLVITVLPAVQIAADKLECHQDRHAPRHSKTRKTLFQVYILDSFYRSQQPLQSWLVFLAHRPPLVYLLQRHEFGRRNSLSALFVRVISIVLWRHMLFWGMPVRSNSSDVFRFLMMESLIYSFLLLGLRVESYGTGTQVR